MVSTRNFHLYPFAASPLTEKLTISGHVSRLPEMLLIEYRVAGELARVSWPRAEESGGRCHELWRHSCFELFFAIPGEKAYWEANFSANGCWNLYCFTDYRSGMRQEPTFEPPGCRLMASDNLLRLCCSLVCKGLVADSLDLELMVSSVIEDTAGDLTYWAIDHHGPKPDFHNRANFSMVLPKL